MSRHLAPLLATLLIGSGTAAAGSLRASVAKIDITPSQPKWLMGYGARQSTGVHDRIYHRIVAMDDGSNQFYLVSTDVCVFAPTVYDSLAARLKRDLGIEPKQVWWTTTHTHSAPELGPPGVYSVLLKGRSDHAVDAEWTEDVVVKLAQGIKDAKSRLEPARLAIGTGIAFANINRRARDVDGRISLGLNPDGPVDRQIGLIRLERADGSPLALVANYAMHGTVLSGRWMEISGDAQGIVADYVERKLGAPMLHVNGAAGNIAPIYSVYPDPKSGHLTQFNVLLGDRILEANRMLGGATPEVSIWTGESVVESPRKGGLGWPDDLPAYTRNDSTGRPLVRMPVRFARINNTVLWGGPVEMFCEIAMNVRAVSPFANTFFFGYTNGWIGYLPTKAAFAEGGYEPATSPFTDAVERDITQAVTTFLQGIPR